MKKIHLFIALLFCAFFSFSQEKVLVFHNDLKTDKSLLNQMFSVENKENNTISIFFVDAKNMYGYLINEENEIVSRLKVKDKKRKYTLFLGYRIKNNGEYLFYLSNQSYSSFAVVNFSYKTGKSTLTELDFKLKKEKLLHTVNDNNKFTIITYNKTGLSFYSFENNHKIVKNEIDFMEDKLYDQKGKQTSLYNLLENSIQSTGPLVKINESIPNPINMTSAYSKLYVIDGKAILTFDHNKTFTQVISIDLSNYDKQIKHLKKPFLMHTSWTEKKSNSFILEDKIYMLACTDKNLNLSIKKFETDVLINEYQASNTDEIVFKNTAVIKQNNTRVAKKQKNKKTEKFLKKISSSFVGVSTYKLGDVYQVSFGGSAIHTGNESTLIASQFGLFGVFLYHGLNSLFNTYNTFNSYTNSSSTYVKGVFDKDLNHIEGEITPNAFDKISDFKQENKIGKTNSETIIKSKNNYIYAYYNPQTRICHLWKFEN